MIGTDPSACAWHRDQGADERADLIIQTVACVRCGALRGRACMTLFRRPTQRLHGLRWDMAEAIACRCPLHPALQAGPR